MTKNKNFIKIALVSILLSLGLTASIEPRVAVASSGQDILGFMGCNDSNKDGLDFGDCLSGGNKGPVTSFTDFKGELKAPNPEGYASGLTQAKDARSFILNVVNFALGFLGLLAVLVVIYGGFSMVVSGGGEGYEKGKKMIGYSVIGLIVIMSSFALVNTVLLAPSDGGRSRTASSIGGSGGSIRGVAGNQRFNYLAAQVDQILLRVYNSYQFHLKVKQDIDNAIASIEAFNTDNCFVPMSTCATELSNSINNSITAITDNLNDSRANAIFKTNWAAYINKISQNSRSKLDAIRLQIAKDDCDSLNKSGDINACTDDERNVLRGEMKRLIYDTTVNLKAADFLTKSFEEDLNWSVLKTAEVLQSVSGLSSSSLGLPFFQALLPGYAKTLDSKLPTKVADESSGEFGRLNNDMKNQLKIGASLATTLDQTSIKNTLKNLLEIKSILQNLQFVNSIITADINQGNAPLIVNLSSVGSADPSGFTITEDRIEWDLNGDGKFSGEPGAFNGTDEGKGYLNCAENKKATSSCIFTRAGTYRVALRIKPVAGQVNPATGLQWNQEIAPGIAYLDILVNPPATKINLNVRPLKGGAAQTVIEYDSKTGTVQTDTTRIYFTLDQARAGLVFDATKSKYSDGQTPLTNDPTAKIRWNFGLNSPNNDSYMIPSDKSLSIEQAYPQIGNYQVRFEVTDKNNVVDRKIFTVVVSNVAPRIMSPALTGKVGEEITFDGSESTSDGGPIIFNWKVEHLSTMPLVSWQNLGGWLLQQAHAQTIQVLNEIKPSISSKTQPPLPLKLLEPTKRAEDNQYYRCAMPAGKDDLLKCTFKKAGEYRITLSLDDDGIPREESTVIQISSTAPTAAFKVTKLNDSAPALYLLDASALSFDPDENDNHAMEYSWEISPANCVLIGFANQTPLDQLIAASVDSLSSQISCDKLKEFNSNIGQPVVKFTQKGDYAVNLGVRNFDEPNLSSTPEEQIISVANTLDVTWGEMKPSAVLKVTGDTMTGADQLPKEVNNQPAAPIKFIFSSSQAISYELDFGDGTNTSGEMQAGRPSEVTHNYTPKGKYTAKLSVFDADDLENSLSRKIFIGDSDSPIAIIETKINGSIVQPQNIELDNGRKVENVIRVNRKDNLIFDAGTSLNTDGTSRRLNYSWNLNNNEKQSASRQLTHNFSQLSTNGEPYTVKLKVSNERDATQTGEDSVNIMVVGEQPLARSLTASVEGGNLTTPVTVRLSAVGANDPDGQIMQYKWWYYDANKPPSPDERMGLQITSVANAQIPIGTRGLEGEKPRYKFGLEITDNDNLTVSTDNPDEQKRLKMPTPELQVTNGPNKAPVARFTVDRSSINVGESVNFTSSSFDPDAGGSIKEYKWDFGDGTRGENKASLSHTYQKANSDGYKVKLTVVDSNSSEAASDIIKIFVDAVAGPPVPGFVTEQTPGSKAVKFNDTSTADNSAGASLKKYSWDFDVATDSNGDGKKDNDIESGEASPSHTYPEFGIYRAKLTVEDNQGQSRSVTNFVNVKPPTPAVAPNSTSTGSAGSNNQAPTPSSATPIKTTGANFFEASTKVEPGLLGLSIAGYVILILISRKNKIKSLKNK